MPAPDTDPPAGGPAEVPRTPSGAADGTAAAVGPADDGVDALRERIGALTLRDERRLSRALDRLRSIDDDDVRARDLAKLLEDASAAEARVAERRALLPAALHYPPELPVSERREDLLEAIGGHQVVVVAGETGSGKTTQIPKLCLELGRGVRGQIAHTQPRRLAARTVAERIAEEVGSPLGEAVGYSVRFEDRSADRTLVRLMTDGLLLAEVQRDRDLRRYDTIVVDEAHERSLNVDFLLGYLHRLLPRRPDLKLVITSATIETGRFAEHFGGAPVVEVSGRTFPVEVRYRPLALWRGEDGTDHDGLDGADEGDADGGAPVPRDGAPARPAPAGDDAPAPPEERDETEAIGDAIEELLTLERAGEGPAGAGAAEARDVLVFLSGEREIRDTADALADRFGARIAGGGSPKRRQAREIEVLPLYARLSSAEQQRVFRRASGDTARRVVLATNVAETSLTVPGIGYVVDAGTARISRYSARLKVQRLPIEPISQASARQRAGRCGRLAPGVCVRLYAEEDFEARPAFTDPEILRTSLAAVILRMADLGLGSVEDFPFLDPPDRRQVRDGLLLLHELGALDRRPTGRAEATSVAGGAGARRGGRGRDADGDGPPRLTDVGRTLARLPIDPRLARMVVEADRLDCVDEVLVIAAALSVQDPRERPAERRATADQLHARFKDDSSDFLGYLNLWRHLRRQQRELSGNQFRKRCRAEFLHVLRIREWMDLHGQLRQAAKRVDVVPNREPATAAQIHQALLAGLLSHVGLRDPQQRGEYQGARSARFRIFPGSVLSRGTATWVMAGELVETSRLWGRTAARIQPEWIEPVAGHLLSRTYDDPRWDPDQGAVVATERASLYGLPVVGGRAVDYARLDPVLARDLFVRHALVGGDWTPTARRGGGRGRGRDRAGPGLERPSQDRQAGAGRRRRRRERRAAEEEVREEAETGTLRELPREGPFAFLGRNADLVAEVEALEERARRRGILAGDEPRVAFFDERIPEEVVSAAQFDRWWKDEQRRRPDLLDYPRELLVADEGALDLDGRERPDAWRQGDLVLPLSYRFEPGTENDGVTAHVPLKALPGLRTEGFEWLVPAFRLELVTTLLRGLPKDVRRPLVPVPGTAAELLGRLQARRAPLPEALSHALLRRRGVRVGPEAFDLARLPTHLRMTFRIEDDDGRVVAEAQDLDGLRERLAPRLRRELAEATPDLERHGLTSWTIGTLPRDIELPGTAGAVRAYPSLVDEGETAGVRVLDDPQRQAAGMRQGTLRLLTLVLPSPARAVARDLGQREQLALLAAPHGSLEAVVADAQRATLDALLDPAGGVAWDADAFDALVARLGPVLRENTAKVMRQVVRVCEAAREVQRRLETPAPAAAGPAVAGARRDVAAQLGRLLFRGFVTATGVRRLPDVERYLRAAAQRLDRLASTAAGDADRTAAVHELEAAYRAARDAHPADRPLPEDLVAVRWMLEELRVQHFAPGLGTKGDVSTKRVRRALEDVAR